jgi:phage gpG-like protein
MITTPSGANIHAERRPKWGQVRRSHSSGGKAIGNAGNSAANLPALYRNHVWSYDFMSARTVDGGALRILNVLDEHTREAHGSKVARSIGSESVRKHLEKLFATHGKPKYTFDPIKEPTSPERASDSYGRPM